jgi:hypothetical protein
MKKFIIIAILMGLLWSCKDEAKINNPKVNITNFTLKAIELKGRYVTVVITNKKGEKFAYAERSQIQSGETPYSQIRFSKTSCDTIKTLDGNAISLYEFSNDENGKMMLKATSGINYIRGSFQIN